MTIKEAIQFLKMANEWRRGAEIPQPDPKLFGVAIDVLTEYYENMTKVIV